MIEEVIKLSTQTDGGKSVKSIREEIRAAQQEAIAAARSFGEFSPQATEAAKKVAKLKDEMGDFQERVAALNPDRFQAIAGVIQGVAGGITAATGAMALFGGESEEVNKILAKVQGAIAFSQGVQQILDLRNSFGAVANVIKTQVVTAFSTLKGALLTTGIGALVIAIGVAIEYFNSLADAAEKAAEAVDKNIKFIDEVQKLDALDLQTRINKAKENGATEKQIFDLRRAQALNHYNELLQAQKEAGENGYKFDQQIREARKQLEIDESAFLADQAEKRRDKQKQEQEKAQADQKKAYEERIALEKEFQDTIDQLNEEQDKNIEEGLKTSADIHFQLLQQNADGREKEQRELQKWYDEQIQDQFLTGQARLDLQELLRLRSLEIDKKYDDQSKKDADAKAAQDLADKKKKDDELIVQEKKTQDALKAAKQAGFDSASQLLGNISQLLEQGSAEQKAFAIAQVLVDEAKAIAGVIAGASEAAAATGPAAPIAFAAYVTSGLATVAASFKRVKDILGTKSGGAPQVAPPQTLNPTTQSFTGGSDELGGNMRVFVTEGDISKTQAKVARNRSVSVI